jgi:hypothetical protein
MTQSTPTTAPGAPRNSFGITALVLGLVGLVSSLSTGFLALALGALAVLFSLLGWARIRRGEATNRKVTVIGTVLGIGALALGVWGITITLNTVSNSLGAGQSVTLSGANANGTAADNVRPGPA